MTPRSKLLCWGCAALLLLGLLLVGVILALAELGSRVEGIEITLQAPAAVRRGEPFVITARVHNSAAERQTLVDLDVDRGYLTGIAITSSRPPWKEARDLLAAGTSYAFERALEPGEELVLELQATGVRSGDFTGDFDFCINSSLRFMTQVARTVVRD